MFALLGKVKVLALAGTVMAGVAVAAPAASAHERVNVAISLGGFFAPPAAVVYQAPVVVAAAPVCQTPVLVAPAPVIVAAPIYVPAPVFYHPDHVIYRGYDRFGWHR
jgi:hypothetical protein